MAFSIDIETSFVTKFPTAVPDVSVLPRTNLFADSSHPINTFEKSVPRLIINPASFGGSPAIAESWSLDNSMRESSITIFVVLLVVVSPYTNKLP